MYMHDRYKNVDALFTVGNENVVYLYGGILISSQNNWILVCQLISSPKYKIEWIKKACHNVFFQKVSIYIN